MPAVIPLAVGLAGTAAGVISGQDAARKQQHAVQDAQKIAQETQYQPIDIAKLTQAAHEQAVQNATDSLALERSLQPDVADTRANLAKSVSDQLSLGGALPADVANLVTRNARVTGGAAGALGGASVPLTAQMLGVSSLSLLNQRQNNAANLLSANPLPVAGLDPGTLASLEVNQNAAQNQFNLAKAGINTNLVNSAAQAGAAQTGANASGINSILSFLTRNQGSGVDSGSILGKLASAYGGSSNPATNPIPVYDGSSSGDYVPGGYK